MIVKPAHPNRIQVAGFFCLSGIDPPDLVELRTVRMLRMGIGVQHASTRKGSEQVLLVDPAHSKGVRGEGSGDRFPLILIPGPWSLIPCLRTAAGNPAEAA